MSPDRWTETELLFQTAAALAPEARLACLDACPDAALRAEVEALLNAHDRAGVMDGPLGLTDFLVDAPSLELPTGVAPAEDGLAPGTRVGPYRVERELGRGGMGRVYLAHRAEGGFEQAVALKVVRPDAGGAFGATVRERFLRERALLAGLDHPAIARLLDGGQTPDGEPYFALEPIAGEPLTAYADRERLGVEARIRLFLQVCDAVAYAHRRLVAHRDLKPSNVLVTPDGHAKLLDFGVARLLDGSDTDGETTAPGARPFTPDYAAPEQIRGEATGTAADVWALGVLLHRVLAGRRPFALSDRRPHAVLAALARGAEAPSHSAARSAHDGDATPEAVAAARSTTPERLGRRLAGDLDAIVGRCLRPEPEARYASVDALADDLRRHLDGRPVDARRGTRRYRAARFVRRHHAGIAATAAVVGLALALAVTSTVQARQTRRALDRARAEAANTAAVSDFLASLMSAQNPRGETDPATPIATVLRDGAARAERELAGQPLVLARLLETVGIADVDLGAYGAADTLLTRSLALRRRHAGPGSTDVAAAMQALGVLELMRGEPARAESLLTASLGIRRQRLPPGAPEIAHTLVDLGNACADQGETARALTHLGEAIALLRRDAPGASIALANALNDTGAILASEGRFAEALAPLRESAALRRRLQGPRHPDLATTRSNEGRSLLELGRVDEALPVLREASALARVTFGLDHPTTASIEANEARGALAAGDTGTAGRLARRLLAARRAALPPGHPSVGTALKLVADVDAAEGHAARAKRGYRDALALFRAAHDGPHPNTAGTLLALGTLLARDGRTPEALPILAEADAMARETLPAAHPKRGEAARALAAARRAG